MMAPFFLALLLPMSEQDRYDELGPPDVDLAAFFLSSLTEGNVLQSHSECITAS